VIAATHNVEKSTAVLSEAKDAYIPSLLVSGGVGQTYGITLTVPTIFTASAQSLIFSASHRHYVRGAALDLQAAVMKLNDTREQVEEDTAITYIRLDVVQRAEQALMVQQGFAANLVKIVEKRFDNGLESSLELQKTRRTAVQIHLAKLSLDEELIYLQQHLGQLTGDLSENITIISESIPRLPEVRFLQTSVRDPWYSPSSSALSSVYNAQAREESARGDSLFVWRPFITFNAQYGRISPINDVSEYYNLHGKYDTASAGIQIQIPIIDEARRAKAREAKAVALHARAEADAVQDQLKADRVRLRHLLEELSAKAELAELDQEIATEELRGVLERIKSIGAGPPLTPKDEMNARILEQQRLQEVLDATFQLKKTAIFYLRQTDQLQAWINGSLQQTTSASRGE